MLRFKNISIAAGEKSLFRCNELLLGKGLYALVGRNGTGKSTFINTILGEHHLENGEITINDKSLADISLISLARSISIVRSKPRLYGEYRTADVLMLGRLPHQGMLSVASVEDRKIVKNVAERLGITHLLKREYNSLSDGEKQLVMVGRAFVQNTDIILLDEPTAFLDLVNRQELLKHLKKLADDQDKLILFSTHHIEILSKFCDAVLLIHNAQLQLLSEKTTFETTINQAFGLNSTS